MEYYRTALVLGYGRSGRAAERLLLSEGSEVVVLTEETAGLTEVIRALDEDVFDVCITSPGFALDHPWFNVIREAGIPLLSELELGWSRHKGKTVAVTGSNGKSTAVKWIHEMLRLAGYNTEIGGNYGIPACETVMDHPDLDWLVLEISSFQLETVRGFRAEVSVLLNVLPNHLNRHKTIDNYRRIKSLIFGSPSLSGDTCLVPSNLLTELKKDLNGAERPWITFGGTSDADYFFEKGLVFRGSKEIVDLSGTLFDNQIIGSCTGAAVAAVADACGISCAFSSAAARAFKPLPHRLQRVGKLNGVTYINDSKATNLAAMEVALQACGENIHLIAGGLPKESDYTFIKEILAERVRSIYLLGQASRAMYQAWSGFCRCVECGTLKKAFNTAKNAAKSGEVILLSPGCASFDQFGSFEERGERFKALFHDSVQGEGDAS